MIETFVLNSSYEKKSELVKDEDCSQTHRADLRHYFRTSVGDGSNAVGWITFSKGYRVHNLWKHLNIHVAINCDAC